MCNLSTPSFSDPDLSEDVAKQYRGDDDQVKHNVENRYNRYSSYYVEAITCTKNLNQYCNIYICLKVDN